MIVENLKDGDFFHVKGGKKIYLWLNGKPWEIAAKTVFLNPLESVELIGRIVPDKWKIIFSDN